MKSIRIDESKLSTKSKDFIRKFKHISQSKYDELSRKVAERPVTADHAEYIMQ